jgi:parallel beta-helix repeat protein
MNLFISRLCFFIVFSFVSNVTWGSKVFTVTSLADAGPGSLRVSLNQANASKGADQIVFSVTGTILLSSSLPSIMDTVTIISDLGALGPLLQIDFNKNNGLVFAKGSLGSILSGLSLVNANNDALILNDKSNLISNNFIGLDLDGSSVLSNKGDGVRISATSGGNVIGTFLPAENTSYTSFGSQFAAIQGIRASSTTGSYVMCGTSTSNEGLVYEGPSNGIGGRYYPISVPSSFNAYSTSVYGPDVLLSDQVRLVGSFRNSAEISDGTKGFIYTGNISGNRTEGYQQVAYPGTTFTYLHSTDGGLVVGNYDSDSQLVGKAFIYDIAADKFIKHIRYPGAKTTTAYGIIQNGKSSQFTIAGGYGLNGSLSGHAFIVDYDSKSGKFSNWTSYDLYNLPATEIVTHFEGISANSDGTYTLATAGLDPITSESKQGALAIVSRLKNGSFSPASYTTLSYLNSDLTIPTSVAGSISTGLALGPTTPYTADTQLTFKSSNIISGNGGNGIGVYGGHDNIIYSNYIGTDLTGTLDLGNQKSGILLTSHSLRNNIGGVATGGNNPTSNVFAVPPQGNLISGNGDYGVRIDKNSQQNTLSGNYIGTQSSGNLELGNTKDGVSIDGANNNSLLGTTFSQPPFVFYNVISGNGGEGLSVNNSNNIIVQANFFGVGSNNNSLVPNAGNGVLIKGTSRNTQFGGVIPLGNVSGGNALNGIEVKDKVRGFISFNTFGGLFAFAGAAPNGGDGILITSSGGNNLLRTNVISGNMGNGIHISGDAKGVTIDPNIVGLDTTGEAELSGGSNHLNGVLIDGNANHITIGGSLKSIIPQNTFSGNGSYGLAILGNAHDNIVFNTFVGVSSTGNFTTLGNKSGGILVAESAKLNRIGPSGDEPTNIVNYNIGNGISLLGASNNEVISNTVNRNTASGIYVNDSFANAISNNLASFNSFYGYQSKYYNTNSWFGNSGYGNTLGLFAP